MRRIVTLSSALFMAATLPGCALMDRFTGQEPTAIAEAPGQIEPVHAAAIVHDQAVFRVSSNGCTRKADLTPVVRRAGDASVITLRRLKEDRCLEPIAQGVSEWVLVDAVTMRPHRIPPTMLPAFEAP